MAVLVPMFLCLFRMLIMNIKSYFLMQVNVYTVLNIQYFGYVSLPFYLSTTHHERCLKNYYCLLTSNVAANIVSGRC